MKRLFLSGVLSMFLLGSAIAAASVKFTCEATLDGAPGTIEATVKTNKKGNTFVTCTYFLDPNNQYAGLFQATNPQINLDSGEAVCGFCEQNYANRVLPK